MRDADMNERCDVIVLGGGVVGSSVAMGLTERGLSVLVVDIDMAGRLSSSEKNAGGVRATWWQPVNVALCLASIGYYETIAKEVGFRQKGYLWLYDEPTWAQALEHLEMQRAMGHSIVTLTPDSVHQRMPEIDRLDGIAGATFAAREGLINPNLLKEHYRARSRERGARYLDRVYVHSIAVESDEVRLECWQSPTALTDEALARTMSQDEGEAPRAGRALELRAESIVIAGGAWSGNELALLGLENYSHALRRQIAIVDSRATNLAAYGMVVDTSGLYFHNEGAHILAGYSPADTPPGFHFNYDGEKFFTQEIWPRMFARMSCMERLRHVGGWAGLYDMSRDRSAIVGRATARIFEAHSFSGRGVMESWGAGQALAELIARGRYASLDASALSRERFTSGALAFEALHI